MSDPTEVPDSTDWLSTPLAALAPIESSLRCQVCKDFYTTPMITTCCHTFCSLCIRRYLSQEGQCPTCRKADQEMKLRRNWVVEELVENFKSGRDTILKYARSVRDEEDEPPKKRRKVQSHSTEEPVRRSTRSRNAIHANVKADAKLGIEIQDSDEGSQYEDESEVESKKESTRDGLVDCPICGKRMKVEVINLHLDKNCQDIETTTPPSTTNTPNVPISTQMRSRLPTRSMQPLPTINYSMFTETQLRKKLKDLGIPNTGSKELMRKRHTEWYNLWNANCDARNPLSKSQLLGELTQWERTLGRQVEKGPSGVMIKDFDRDKWQQGHKSDFDDLIRQARAKAKQKATIESASIVSSNTAPETETSAVMETLDRIEDSDRLIGSRERDFPSYKADPEKSGMGPKSIDAIIVPEALENSTHFTQVGEAREVDSLIHNSGATRKDAR